MSYEGYVEHLCPDGHYWAVDAYMESTPERCPRCGKSSAWSHDVDETNGVQYDESGEPYPNTVPWPLEVDRYEEVVIRRQEPVYKLPCSPE
jgi:hypothetical protein